MFITPVRQAPMFDSKQLHVKLSKRQELDPEVQSEVRFRIAPKLGHSSDITTQDSLLVRQLWLNFMLPRALRSSAPLYVFAEQHYITVRCTLMFYLC